MKNLKIFFLCIAIISGTLTAQPLFKINIHGGYSLPLPDLKGDLKDSADQYNTLTMSNGYNIGIDGKYFPFKKKNIAFTFSLNYNMFQTSIDSGKKYFELGYAVIQDAKYKLNSISFGIGAEYSFSPKNKFNPFAGAEMTGSYFTGSEEFKNGGNTHNNNLQPASRFGFAAGFGFDYILNKSIGFTAGGKYNLANLIGKKSTFIDLESAEYPLFDGEIETFAAKNISYIQFYLGVTFYFGQPKNIK